MALRGIQFITFVVCLERFIVCTYTSGNDTIESLVDKSILNLQQIKLKYQSLLIIKKLYGDCLPCRPIEESKYCDCTNAEPMQDCMEFRQAGYIINGIYRLNGPTFNQPTVFCDQTTQGGGWTILLRRQDGSVNFRQNWKGYKHGFGRLTGEFWLGNEIVHDLTKKSVAPKKSELLINMIIKGKNRPRYAKYATFELEEEEDKYTIKFGGASGNATNLAGRDSFENFHNNKKFSTYDMNNDPVSPRDCSNEYGGVGWWFNRCYSTFLTRAYGSVTWYGSAYEYAEFVEMKFRRKI